MGFSTEPAQPPKTLGNSGFEYILQSVGKKQQAKLKCTIQDIKTKDPIKEFTGSGTFFSYRGTSGGSTATCKILGYDKKYYYLQITQGRLFAWGQIQSDGAVLKSDRSILTTLAFFPHYKDPATNVPPTSPIIVKEPPNIPKVVVVPPTPVKAPIPKEDISWIQKIINWIIMILNR